MPLLFAITLCARTHAQGFVGSRHESYTLAVGFLFAIFFFGSLRSHSLSKCCRLQARVSHTCCWILLAIFFFSSLRSHSLSESYTLRIGFCLLYFSSARCAHTHSQRVVGCSHKSYMLAVGILFAIFFFSSLHLHPLSGYFVGCGRVPNQTVYTVHEIFAKHCIRHTVQYYTVLYIFQKTRPSR